MENDYLVHHGVKGMKWGRRKQRAKENSAARDFYRTERTNDFNKYRKYERRKNLKEARLSSKDVKSGRYRVAKARSIKRNAASVAMGALVGTGAAAAITASGGTAALALMPIIGASSLTTLGAHFGTGAHYYGKQRKAYKKGLKRAS